MATEKIVIKGLAPRLKQVVKFRGLTYESISEQLDVPISTVHSWIQGRHEPSLFHFRELLKVLDVSADAILDEKELEVVTKRTFEALPKSKWVL